MRKIKSLRRIAVIIFAFFIGLITSGNYPTWIVIAFCVVCLSWLMAYDEAVYQEEERRKFTK